MEGLRRIQCETIINCRDLGGYRCADGSVTQFGCLFRFGLPHTPPQTDVDTFARCGIRHIFDLRSSFECKRHPNPFAKNPMFSYENIPLYEMNPTFIRKSKALWNIYRLSVDRYPGQYALLLRRMLHLREPAAFHCHGGKDRTGIVAALLLSLAGVERQDILADYQVSATYLQAYYDHLPPKHFQVMGKQKYLLSDPAMLEQLFVYLQQQYGGVTGYLQKAGLSAQELAALSAVLKVEKK